MDSSSNQSWLPGIITTGNDCRESSSICDALLRADLRSSRWRMKGGPELKGFLRLQNDLGRGGRGTGIEHSPGIPANLSVAKRTCTRHFSIRLGFRPYYLGQNHVVFPLGSTSNAIAVGCNRMREAPYKSRGRHDQNRYTNRDMQHHGSPGRKGSYSSDWSSPHQGCPSLADDPGLMATY